MRRSPVVVGDVNLKCREYCANSMAFFSQGDVLKRKGQVLTKETESDLRGQKTGEDGLPTASSLALFG